MKQQKNKSQTNTNILAKAIFRDELAIGSFLFSHLLFILFHYPVFLLFSLFFSFHFIYYYYRLKASLCTFTSKNINPTQKIKQNPDPTKCPDFTRKRGVPT